MHGVQRIRRVAYCLVASADCAAVFPGRRNALRFADSASRRVHRARPCCCAVSLGLARNERAISRSRADASAPRSSETLLQLLQNRYRCRALRCQGRKRAIQLSSHLLEACVHTGDWGSNGGDDTVHSSVWEATRAGISTTTSLMLHHPLSAAAAAATTRSQIISMFQLPIPPTKKKKIT